MCPDTEEYAVHTNASGVITSDQLCHSFPRQGRIMLELFSGEENQNVLILVYADFHNQSL